MVGVATHTQGSNTLRVPQTARLQHVCVWCCEEEHSRHFRPQVASAGETGTASTAERGGDDPVCRVQRGRGSEGSSGDPCWLCWLGARHVHSRVHGRQGDAHAGPDHSRTDRPA